MARIRTVKPEFWTDSKIVQLSPLARLLFIGAWNFADDHGAMSADATQLKLRVLPAEQCDADELVRELLDAGLLVETTNGQETFWAVRGWQKHQKVDKPSKSQFGDPDSWSPAESRRISPNPRDHSPNPRDHSPNPRESRRIPANIRAGKEGKGKEGIRTSLPSGGREEGDSSDADDPPRDEAAATFELHFWPIYPPTNGRKPEKGRALAQWRKLTLEQRRRAVIGARNLAASDAVPKYAHRFLRRDTSGEFPFDDWQQPVEQPRRARDGTPEPRARREPEVGSPEWEQRQREQEARAAAILGEQP